MEGENILDTVEKQKGKIVELVQKYRTSVKGSRVLRKDVFCLHAQCERLM